MIKSHLTSLGIPGIGAVPYGIHMCHFYPEHRDLLDGLASYFQTGLANNERCVWVAPSAQLGEIGAEIAKSAALQSALAAGQIKILDAMEWVAAPGKAVADEMVGRWLDEEERAVADGFQGLRVGGDTSFFSRDRWEGLMEYEEQLHNRIRGRRMLVCCSYHRAQCRAVDILDVVLRHDGALDRNELHWEVYLRTELGAMESPRPSHAGLPTAFPSPAFLDANDIAVHVGHPGLPPATRDHNTGGQ